MRNLWFVFMVSSALLLHSSLGRSQSTFGSITGTVKDPSGALVPGADVRVMNEGTGAIRQTTSDSAGVFNVPNLDVGSYRLTVSAKGFSTYEVEHLSLLANQVLSREVQLEVGASVSVVRVQATVQAISTATNDISAELRNNEIVSLPLDARHDAGTGGIYSQVTLGAGTNYTGSSGVPTIQGARSLTGTLPTMDGIGSYAYQEGANAVQPDMDSIAEVKVERIDAPAEFPTAANIQVVTRGGTDQYHGAVYEDYNGDALNSRTFFASKVPFRVYNEFGGYIGGPIKKNKLFFFGDITDQQEAATTSAVESVPLPAWRTGNFGSLLTTSVQTGTDKCGQPIYKGAITNPTNGCVFPNNVIPSGQISTVSLNTQNYIWPLPNAGTPGVVANDWSQLLRAPTTQGPNPEYDARVDYNLSTKDAIFVRGSVVRIGELHVNGAPYPIGRLQDRHGKSAVLAWTHTFAPSLLNEARFGATYHRNHYTSDVNGSTLLQQFGITGIPAYTGQIGLNDPYFNITGVSTWNPAGSSFFYEDKPQTTFEFLDNLSWTHGRHLMKFGFMVLRDRFGGVVDNGPIDGEYDFTGTYTGSGYADFLLGIPQTTELSLPLPNHHLKGMTYGLYGQDQFKVNSSLTLNYGLRWELPLPYHDSFGLVYNFDPQNGDLVIPNNAVKLINPFFPTNLPIITASAAGYPANSLVNQDLKNIEPRFGFAYKLFGSDKTVIRGGYGIYTNLVYLTLAGSAMSGGPYSGSTQYINSITNGVPLFSFPSPFLTTGTTSTQSVNAADPNLRTPYTQQWNLTVERQLGGVGLRVSYIGDRSVKLLYDRNINQPQPSTTTFSTSERFFPLYSAIDYIQSGGNQFYNALEVAVRKAYGQNLTLNLNYTWAKDLTDSQDNGGGGQNFGGQVIQNQFSRAAEKGNNQITIPQRFVGTVLYALPVGQGQHFLSKANGVLQGFLGGWRTMWMVEDEAGEYFSPSFSGFDTGNTGIIGGRPDVIAGVPLYPANKGIYDWFNANAFKIPGCPDSTPVCTAATRTNIGRFGNAGINTIEGPPLFGLNLAIMKEFQIREHLRLQFTVESSNVLNHSNFSNPAANISSTSTVGVISGETSPFSSDATNRQFDFLLHLQF